MIKVLIVDDEPLVCAGISSMLRYDDSEIEILGSAHNGQEAEDMIRLMRPEIVITDIKMPVMSGLDLVDSSAKRYGRIPLFIILTSFDDFEYARRALQTRVVDYLIKLELTQETLRNSIEKAIKILSEHRRLESHGWESRIGGAQFHKERFFLMLYNNLFETKDQYYELQKEAAVDFAPGPFVAAICELTTPVGDAATNNDMTKLFDNTKIGRAHV